MAERSSREHRAVIAKLLQANAHRRHMWDVFADFVEMSALAISNAIDIAQYDEREQRYMQIVKRYEPDEVRRFPQMLGALVEAMEAEPSDVLGALFGELDLGNAARGQFFTPYELCRLLARMCIDDAMRQTIVQRGFVTAQEPAVGAGAMVVALATEMREVGINYQQHLHVTAIDVDSRAVHMAYVQFSLLHIPAVIVLGNTLTLEQREVWRTPAHLMGLWEQKLRRGYSLGTPADRADQPQLAPVPIQIGQLELFGAAA